MAYSVRKSCNITVWRSESGVTLLEVLAALSIMVVLLSVLAQLLNTGGRMWTKNDHAYQKQHQLQNVYQVLAKDLQSAYCSEFLPEAALQGDEREMAFWRETPTGLQKITYRYDPTQKVLYRAAGFWGEKLEETPLFQDILTWKFEYFEEQSRNWKYNWDAQIKTAVPSLVKVTATTGLTNLGSLVIPLEIGPKEEND